MNPLKKSSPLGGGAPAPAQSSTRVNPLSQSTPIDNDHGYLSFTRTMPNGEQGISLMPRGVMQGAHGGWGNFLDFVGADDWAGYHRDIAAREYAYNDTSSLDDVLEDDIGVWETAKRAANFGGETSLRSVGELIGLGGMSGGAGLTLKAAAATSPWLANQWERMVDERRRNRGIYEDGNVIENFDEYAGQFPGALTTAVAERVGARAMLNNGPLATAAMEIGTEAGSEVVEDVSTKFGTPAQGQIDPAMAALGGALGSLPQAGGQAALSTVVDNLPSQQLPPDLQALDRPAAVEAIPGQASTLRDLYGATKVPTYADALEASSLISPFAPNMGRTPASSAPPISPGPALPPKPFEFTNENLPTNLGGTQSGLGRAALDIGSPAFPQAEIPLTGVNYGSDLNVEQPQKPAPKRKASAAPIPVVPNPSADLSGIASVAKVLGETAVETPSQTPSNAPQQPVQSEVRGRGVSYDIGRLSESVGEAKAREVVTTVEQTVSNFNKSIQDKFEIQIEDEIIAPDGSSVKGKYLKNNKTGQTVITISASEAGSTRDIALTVAEEVAIHGGLREVYSEKEIGSLFTDIYKENYVAIDKWAKEKGYYQKDNELERAEEWAADMARDRVTRKLNGEDVGAPTGAYKKYLIRVGELIKNLLGLKKRWSPKQVEDWIAKTAEKTLATTQDETNTAEVNESESDNNLPVIEDDISYEDALEEYGETETERLRRVDSQGRLREYPISGFEMKKYTDTFDRRDFLRTPIFFWTNTVEQYKGEKSKKELEKRFKGNVAKISTHIETLGRMNKDLEIVFRKPRRSQVDPNSYAVSQYAVIRLKGTESEISIRMSDHAADFSTDVRADAYPKVDFSNLQDLDKADLDLERIDRAVEILRDPDLIKMNILQGFVDYKLSDGFMLSEAQIEGAQKRSGEHRTKRGTEFRFVYASPNTPHNIADYHKSSKGERIANAIKNRIPLNKVDYKTLRNALMNDKQFKILHEMDEKGIVRAAEIAPPVAPKGDLPTFTERYRRDDDSEYVTPFKKEPGFEVGKWKDMEYIYTDELDSAFRALEYKEKYNAPKSQIHEAIADWIDRGDPNGLDRMRGEKQYRDYQDDLIDQMKAMGIVDPDGTVTALRIENYVGDGWQSEFGYASFSLFSDWGMIGRFGLDKNTDPEAVSQRGGMDDPNVREARNPQHLMVRKIPVENVVAWGNPHEGEIIVDTYFVERLRRAEPIEINSREDMRNPMGHKIGDARLARVNGGRPHNRVWNGKVWEKYTKGPKDVARRLMGGDKERRVYADNTIEKKIVRYRKDEENTKSKNRGADLRAKGKAPSKRTRKGREGFFKKQPVRPVKNSTPSLEGRKKTAARKLIRTTDLNAPGISELLGGTISRQQVSNWIKEISPNETKRRKRLKDFTEAEIDSWNIPEGLMSRDEKGKQMEELIQSEEGRELNNQQIADRFNVTRQTVANKRKALGEASPDNRGGLRSPEESQVEPEETVEKPEKEKLSKEDKKDRAIYLKKAKEIRTEEDRAYAKELRKRQREMKDQDEFSAEVDHAEPILRDPVTMSEAEAKELGYTLNKKGQVINTFEGTVGYGRPLRPVFSFHNKANLALISKAQNRDKGNKAYPNARDKDAIYDSENIRRYRRAETKEQRYERIWGTPQKWSDVDWFNALTPFNHKAELIPQNVRDAVNKAMFRINSAVIESTNGKVDLTSLSISGLGGLDNQKAYKEIRYKMMGKYLKADNFAKQIYNLFRKSDKNLQGHVFDYLTGKIKHEDIGKGLGLPVLEVKEVADGAKALHDQIVKNGEALVKKGMLKQETVDKNSGYYLPRMYLKHVLGKENFSGMQGGGTISNQSYLKKRQDLEPHVRDLMGEIVDPGYLGATTVANVGRDIATIEALDEIVGSGNQNWVLDASMVNVELKRNDDGTVNMVEVGEGGKKVSAHWLLAEADSIARNVSTGAMAPDAEVVAKAVEADMRAIADRVLSDMTKQKLGERGMRQYRQVPDSKRYGALRGAWIDKRIYNDLFESRSQSDNKYWRTAEQMHSWWKTAKVPLNPSTIIRNIMSNMVLMTLDGMPMNKVVYYMTKHGDGIKDARRVANKYGLELQTFSSQEMSAISKEFRAASKDDKGNIFKLAMFMGKWAKKAANGYGKVEAWQKMALIQYHLDQGANDFDAFLRAQDALFDYSMLNKGARAFRKAPVGAPFLSFYLLSFARLGQVMARNPARALPWLILSQLMWAASAVMEDVDEDDLKRLHDALPDYLANKPSQLLTPLPVRDAEGRMQFLDLAYINPYGAHWETLRLASEGELDEMSDLVGMTGAPLVQFAIALSTGIDPFTKKPITEEEYSLGRKMWDRTGFVWRSVTPSLINSQGALYKMYEAATGKVGASKLNYGEVKHTMGQALARLGGINTYGVDPELSAIKNVQVMKYRMADLDAVYKREIRNPNLSDEKRAEIVAEYQMQKMALAYDMQRMAELANINPKLKVKDMD